MKTQKIILSILLLSGVGLSSFAQKEKILSFPKTETIKVWGNCGMCKNIIEKAAASNGVTYASWNAENDVLVVKYDPKTTNGKNIQQAIAKAGYDTQDVSASDEAYKKLHACCQYERKKAVPETGVSCCTDKNCDKPKGECKDAADCKEKSCCKSV